MTMQVPLRRVESDASLPYCNDIAGYDALYDDAAMPG
jgi:hypothetical protein